MTQEDHDLLIRLESKVDSVIKNLSNHLKHHWAVEMLMLSVIAGAVIKWVFFN